MISVTDGAVATVAFDIALLALRLTIGVGSIAHGWPKLRVAGKFATAHHFPVWLGHVAAWVQLVGGMLVLLGLFTQIAALALALFGLVATTILIVQKNEPFAAPGVHSWDAGVFYTAVPLSIALLGPGRFALDRIVG